MKHKLIANQTAARLQPYDGQEWWAGLRTPVLGLTRRQRESRLPDWRRPALLRVQDEKGAGSRQSG